MNNHLYFIETQYGELKFGSGTLSRVEHIRRITNGKVLRTIDCGAISALSIENHMKGVFASTRIWSRRGEHDGSTELWPLDQFGVMERDATVRLKLAKSGIDYTDPEASDNVVELVQEHIRTMPAYAQLSILDLCAGDGRLTNALADDGAVVHQITIDPPQSLDAPSKANMHVGDMFKLCDNEWASDVVVINPPFSDPDAKKWDGGFSSSKNAYWHFIDKAKQQVKPGGRLIFIAPNNWENGLSKTRRDGTYTVLKYDADFGSHPNASVVEWMAGEFAVVNGRDSRKPEMPRFNVRVLPNLKSGHRDRYQAAVKQTGRLADGAERITGDDIALEGPDADACAAWIVDNKQAIYYWLGSNASGRPLIKQTYIRELLA